MTTRNSLLSWWKAIIVNLFYDACRLREFSGRWRLFALVHQIHKENLILGSTIHTSGSLSQGLNLYIDIFIVSSLSAFTFTPEGSFRVITLNHELVIITTLVCTMDGSIFIIAHDSFKLSDWSWQQFMKKNLIVVKGTQCALLCACVPFVIYCDFAMEWK